MPKSKFIKKNIKKVANSPCTYQFYNKNGNPIYVGSTKRCRVRLNQQLRNIKAPYFSTQMKNSPTQAHSTEKLLCRKIQPVLNLKCG